MGSLPKQNQKTKPKPPFLMDWAENVCLGKMAGKKKNEGNCRYTMYLKTDFGLLKDLNVASILTRREETEAADPASNRLDTDSATWVKVYVAWRPFSVFCSATIMSFQLYKRSKTFVQCFFLLLFLWGWATWLCVCRKTHLVMRVSQEISRSRGSLWLSP